MTCGGAVAAAVISEGMVGSEFFCNSAAGGAKRTGIPLPTGSAKPIQITDYNRFMTLIEHFLGAERGVFPAVRERPQGTMALGGARR
jgi:hypothetical protein